MAGNTKRGIFNTIARVLCLTLFGLATLSLGGCSKSMSGKYEGTGDTAGAMSVEFKSGNKAYMTIVGTTVETDYELDGDKVILKNVNGSNLVLNIDKDGNLTGPMGMTLKKK